ncbi:serine hydrolase [Streptomyces sp. H27-G5]|nr:serine hydrolase [Streptomyces sp. H27-G5]
MRSSRAASLAPCMALVIAGGAVPAGSAATAATRPPPPPAAATNTPTPAASALEPIDPAAFQAAVARAAQKLSVPGAVVLLQTPQGTFRAIVGTSELGKTTPPDTRDHFRIASNTKTMTSALIMLLAQDGALRLTDPVSDYVPGVPNGAHITLAELLKMRSGLYNHTDAPELAAYGGSSYALVDKPYPAEMREAATTGRLRPIDYTFQNPSYATVAGGVVSTARTWRPGSGPWCRARS